MCNLHRLDMVAFSTRNVTICVHDWAKLAGEDKDFIVFHAMYDSVILVDRDSPEFLDMVYQARLKADNLACV